MIKRLLPLASLVLFVALGSFVSAQNGLSIQNSGHQEQQKFYALRVVSEKDVLSANDSLGAPDTRYAEILPGGQLVLLMEKKLYVFLAGTEDGPEDSRSAALSSLKKRRRPSLKAGYLSWKPRATFIAGYLYRSRCSSIRGITTA